MHRLACVLLAASAVAPSLSAQKKLFVGGAGGGLYSADPAVGAFELETTIPAPIGSIAQVGSRVLIAATTGDLYAYFPSTGALTALAKVPSDATDMAVHDGDLLIGGSDGNVLRLDVRTGVIEETLASGFEIRALAVDGDFLYAGTPFGVFQKVDLAASPTGFQFAGICGGPIQSMELTAGELYLGDETGQVYVYDKDSGFVTYAYPIENDAESIVRDGDTFLIGGSDGTIHRVQQITGTKLETLASPDWVADLWLQEPAGALQSDVAQISLATGGAAAFELSAAVGVAGDTYVLLGSASGTQPGISADGVHLALNVDAYFKMTMPPFGDEPIQGGFGAFDASGAAAATLTLPAGLPPILVGTTLHHAFVTWSADDPTTFLGASNSVALVLAP